MEATQESTFHPNSGRLHLLIAQSIGSLSEAFGLHGSMETSGGQTEKLKSCKNFSDRVKDFFWLVVVVMGRLNEVIVSEEGDVLFLLLLSVLVVVVMGSVME